MSTEMKYLAVAASSDRQLRSKGTFDRRLNLRITFFFILFFLFTFSVNSQSSKTKTKSKSPSAPLIAQNREGYHIEGTISGLSKDTMVYLVLNPHDDTIAKANTTNGEFVFKGTLPYSIEWASIRVQKAKKWATFFLENKKIELSGFIESWQSASIKGSSETDYNRELNKAIETLDELYKKNELEKFNSLNNKDNNQIGYFEKKEKEIIDSFLKLKEKFIALHRHSAYTAWLIQNSPEFDLQKKQQKYADLTEAAKQSHFGLQLKDHISELQLRNTIKPGSIVPDFKLSTPEGKLISLNGILESNKLILLDFWASWCPPCRQMNPELRRMYDTFHKKGFTIISISSDKNKEAWKKAIVKDSMNWINATPAIGYENPSAIFDVQAIPAYVLLDSKGRILAIDNELSSINSFGFSKKRDSDAIFAKIAELINN